MPRCTQCQKDVRVLPAQGICPRCLAAVALVESEDSTFQGENKSLLAGRYRLGDKLGEGGFGTVYLAEQLRPLRRQVAVKILRADRVSPEVLARFEAERQALALMDHPHIASIHDGGEEEGTPFYVMEFVDGPPINEFCAKESLTIQERLTLFVQACEAVHYAHRQGIIHRDIKPSNILVARANDSERTPICKVIDFGIAKALNASLTDRTYYTQMFQLVGTPAYMSPEQADTTNQAIDTRSDVYSLGAVFYELLAGTPPFRQSDITHSPLDEVLRRLREEQPERPSTRFHASIRDKETPMLEPVHGDLDWISMRALEKDPERRYESALAFGQDVQRYLQGEPILARPPSTLYQMRLLARRHRGAVIAGSLIFLALMLGIMVSTMQAIRAKRAEVVARQGETKFRELFYVANMNLIQNDWEQHHRGSAQKRLRDTLSYPDRGFEWHYWRRQMNQEFRRFSDHTSGLVDAVHLPGGERVVTLAGYEGFAWDIRTRKIAYRLDRFDGDKAHESHFVSMAISPSGQHLVTAQHHGELTLWNAVNGKRLRMVNGGERMLDLDFSPNGERLVAAFRSRVRVWDAIHAKAIRDLDGHEGLVQAVAYSPDGAKILSGGSDSYAIMWDASTGKELFRVALHDENTGIQTIKFSPDGSKAVSGGWDSNVKLWDADSGEIIRSFDGHQSPIETLDFSPDGSRLLSGSRDQLAKLWNVETGEELLTIKGHRGRITHAHFLDDNDILTASYDTTVAVWDSEEMIQGGIRATLDQGWVSSVAWGPDGSWFIFTDGNRSAYRVDADTGERLQAYQGNQKQLWACAVSSDGKVLLTGGDDHSIFVWNVASGEQLFVLEGHKGTIRNFAFSPNNQAFVSASNDDIIRLWSVEDGKEIAQFVGHDKSVTDVSWLPDGKRFVSTSYDATVRVWEVATKEEMMRMSVEDRGWMYTVAVSPNGRYVIQGGDDQLGRVWDLETGELVMTLKGHTERIWSAEFSPDGKRILTGSYDNTARLWDAKRGEELLVLRGHTAQVWSVAFSQDGKRIVTGSWDKTARVWDAVPIE